VTDCRKENREVPLDNCIDCPYCEMLGRCEYPTPIDTLIKEGKSEPTIVPLWLSTFQRLSTSVVLSGRTFTDLNGNEIAMIPLALQGLEVKGKGEERR